MKPSRWAGVFAVYGLVALAVPFFGYSVPGCFAPAGGQVGEECIRRWQAGMALFPDRLVYSLGGPMAAAVTFLVLAGGTLLLIAVRRRVVRARDIQRR